MYNGFDHRDGGRTLVSTQQPSPRQEQARVYPEPVRVPPAPRSPKAALTVTNASYPHSHAIPQLASTQGPPIDRAPPHTSAAFASPARGPMTPVPMSTAASVPNGVPVSAGTLPSYHRPFTPPTEVRPIRDERLSSPGATYPHQQYHHGPSMPMHVVHTGIAGGAPPPPSAVTAAELAAREREDRPASALKRGREWEIEQGPSKKLASEENRARLDDRIPRRMTPPSRMPSPRAMHHRSSSEAHLEEQRRANESYYPSEAAHHPPTLPSIQQMQPQSHPSSLPPIDSSATASNGAPSGPPSAHSQVKEEPGRSEQQLAHEPAARKMDVDENYDDDGDDDKKASVMSKGSPHGSNAGSANGGMGSGAQGSQAKTESAV